MRENQAFALNLEGVGSESGGKIDSSVVVAAKTS